jgi:arabinofuranan 3-O-arabinosyltransferase
VSLPLGLVPVDAPRWLVFASNLVGILVASAILIRVFDQPLTGLAGALTVLGLSLASAVFDTLKSGNVNGVVLLAEAVFISAAARGSSNLAGLGLGLSLALKPVLAPLIVVPILYRKGGTVLIALGIPVAMSGLVLVSAPRSRDFFSDTVPSSFAVKARSFRISALRSQASWSASTCPTSSSLLFELPRSSPFWSSSGNDSRIEQASPLA